MVLVDSSVWIDFFKKKQTREVLVLSDLLKTDFVLMCDIVMMEVLRGISDDYQFEKIKWLFENLQQVQILNNERLSTSIDWFRLIRKKGFTVRSQMDILLALYCFESGISLLHNDHDFNVIQESYPFNTM